MPSHFTLTQAIKHVLVQLSLVFSDLQERPDVNKDPSFGVGIAALNDFKQQLLNANAAVLPLSECVEAIKDSAENSVLPLLDKWFAANLALSKMGPLNAQRSIPPSMALRHNADLTALQNAVQILLALLPNACCPPVLPPIACAQPMLPCPQPPCPPPVHARLLRLMVEGASVLGHGQYVAEYAPGKAVVVKAVVDPPTPACYESLIWQGGEFACCNDSRLISLDRVTPPDEPHIIAVWLGDTRMRVQVTVRPLFGGFDVSNAVQRGSVWSAQYALCGDPVIIRAAMLPDVPEAYRYLLWEGGCIDPEHPDDRRLVPRSSVTPIDMPVCVSAMFNPRRAVLVEIVPLFTALNVYVGDIRLQPEGKTSQYTIGCGDGYVVLEAETQPAGIEVWSRIVWTGYAENGDLPNRKIIPRNVLTPRGQSGRTIIAKLGETLHGATIKIVPTLLYLAVTGSDGVVYPALRHGDVFKYSIPYVEGQVLSVSAATDPDDANAWSYIVWSGDGSAGAVPNRRNLTRNALTPFAKQGRIVNAGIGNMLLTARIKIVPTLCALTVPLYGFASGLPQQWYSYRLSNPNLFDISDPLPKAVVRAVTVPDNAMAWEYLTWSDNAPCGQVGAGSVACLRTVCLDRADTVTIVAAIGDQQLPAQLDIRNPRHHTPGSLQLALNSIGFDGGRAVTIDYRTGSSVPPLRYLGHFPRIWRRIRPGTAEEYPQRVLYQPPQTYTRNTPIGLSAEFDIVHRPETPPGQVQVRASAFLRRNGVNACRLEWRQPVEIPAEGEGKVAFPRVNSARLPNVVLHEEPWLIFWEVSSGEGQWELFDISEHALYVTYADPVGCECPTLNDPDANAAAYTLWSLLDISCAAAGESGDISGIIRGIYQAFQPAAPNAKLRRKHDGSLFKYWGTPCNVAQQLTARNGAVDPLLLISSASGSSLAFAQMLLAMFALHGIPGARLVEARPNPVVSPEAVRFLVCNWTFNLLPRPSGSSYSHFKRNDGTAPNPLLPAGWATWSAGAGQNSHDPPPALLNHYLVWLNQCGVNLFFDPSYGSIPETTWQAWVKAAVAGLERSQAHLPPVAWYRFALPPEPLPLANAGFVKQGPAFPAQAPDNLVKLRLVADHSELN